MQADANASIVLFSIPSPCYTAGRQDGAEKKTDACDLAPRPILTITDPDQHSTLSTAQRNERGSEADSYGRLTPRCCHPAFALLTF